jgi:hypothetical protein
MLDAQRGRQPPRNSSARLRSMPSEQRLDTYTSAMTAKQRGGLWWLTACWALLEAVSCAYQFFWSTFPVARADEPPGPSWLIRAGNLAQLLTVLSALTLVALLLVGIVYLRRAWQLSLVWGAAVAGAVALEVTFLSGYGVPIVSQAYSGPAVVDWMYLAESAGFLIVGAVLIKIQASPRPSGARSLCAGSRA